MAAAAGIGDARLVFADDLPRALGAIVCAERNRAGLSQAVLAERLRVSQQWLSRIELGIANPSVATVARILAAVGRQLRVDAVPLRSDMDTYIAAGAAMTDEARAIEFGRHYLLLRNLASVPFAITGRMAAMVQRAPVPPPTWVDIIVARHDLDVLAAVLLRYGCRRWNERWRSWGYADGDPRRPGVNRWLIGLSDTRMEFVDELPPTLEVSVGEWQPRVVPLGDVAADDPWLMRLFIRWREQPT